jgi:hypothetical protein
MNGNELFVLVLATAMLAALAYRTTGTIGRTVVSTLMLVPMLFLAIEGATQFLTCDETYMVLELEDVRSSNFRQWNMGGYRTSILLTGTIFSALKGIILGSALTAAELHGLTKSIHWLVGFTVLLMIHESLRRFFVPKDRQPLFFVLFFAVALLLPTNILAFKVANYDLLSMMLGMLSITLTLGALTRHSVPAALGAIVAGSFASQEKIIASPFLALATFAAIFIAATWQSRLLPARTSPSKKQASKHSTDASAISAGNGGSEILPSLPWVSIASTSLAAVLATIVPVMLTWTIVNGIHGGLKFSFARAVTPLTGYLSVASDTMAGASTTFWIVNLGIMIGAVLAALSYRFLRTKLPASVVASRSAPISAFIILVFVVIGIVGTYTFTIYVHPFHPTPEGIYLPTKSFNDATAHYMQPTFASHLLAGVTMSYSVIANGLPTAFWLLLLAVAISGLSKRSPLSIPPAWSGAALFVLLFPLAYAITQTPFGSRYLNLFLFVIAVFVVFSATELLSRLSGALRIGGSAAFVLCIAAELFMFRPVIGAFTPIWNSPYPEFASKPLYGQLLAGHWAGWGEENFTAGRRIASEFRQSGESIRIHCSYPGDWLSNDSTVKMIPYNEITRGVTSSDYYVMSRQAIYQKRYPFPWGVKPLFTVDYGGATMAWVFRGDQLRDNLMFAVPENQGGYVAEMSELKDRANGPNNPAASSLIVYEDGKPLGPPHAPFDEIRKIGKGRYNHWDNVVFFTASDNTDPRTNGRKYTVGGR